MISSSRTRPYRGFEPRHLQELRKFGQPTRSRDPRQFTGDLGDVARSIRSGAHRSSQRRSTLSAPHDAVQSKTPPDFDSEGAVMHCFWSKLCDRLDPYVDLRNDWPALAASLAAMLLAIGAFAIAHSGWFGPSRARVHVEAVFNGAGFARQTVRHKDPQFTTRAPALAERDQ